MLFMSIDDFCRYLTHEKRFSVHTVTAYRNDIAQFNEYLAAVYGSDDLLNTDHQHIRSWLVKLFESGLKARSIKRKLSTLKSYYRFLRKNKILLIDPTQKVSAPKIPKKLPVAIDRKTMDALFDISHKENVFEIVRDYTIVEILYGTGIRLSEIIGIKETDTDTVNGTMMVAGKRSKQRIIPLTPHLIKVIEHYRDIKRKEVQNSSNPDYLIVTKSGRKAYPQLIYRTVHRVLTSVTTQMRRSPHVLRHTFATEMLNNGAELNAIKELLGHASLAATQVYTHNTVERLKQIYQKAHPKA